MARTQARLFTSIWHNDEFLTMSSSAQRLFMLVLSQDTLSFCGVVGYSAKRWAKLAPDTTVKSIRRDVAEAARRRFVMVDDDTEEIWVRTLMRHDGVFKSPNLILAMVRDVDAVHSATIQDAVLDSIRDEFPAGFRQYLTTTFPTGFPKGFPEGFCQLLEKRYGEGFSTRAGAGASSVLLPSTSDLSDPSGEGSREESEPHASNGNPPWASDPLVIRWCDEVTGNHRTRHRMQVWDIVEHYRRYLDQSVIDETIGRLAQLDKKPGSPNYLRTTLDRVAQENDVEVPALEARR